MLLHTKEQRKRVLVEVDVTKEDIAEGKCSMTKLCAVARAMTRALGVPIEVTNMMHEPHGGFEYLWGLATVADTVKDFIGHPLPAEVSQWIALYDACDLLGTRSTIRPISFSVRVPVAYLAAAQA